MAKFWSGSVASLKFDCLVQTGVVVLVNNQILSLGVGGGVGGEKLKLMLTQSSCAGAGTELGNVMGLDTIEINLVNIFTVTALFGAGMVHGLMNIFA